MEDTPTYLPGTKAPKEKPATPAFVINISHDTLFREMCEFSRTLSYTPTMEKSRAQVAREYLHEHLTEYKAHIAEAINTAIGEEQKSEKAAMAEKAAFHQNKAIEASLEFQKKLALERNGPAPTPQDAVNLIEQIKNATEDAEYTQRIEGLLKTAMDAGWKDLAERLDYFPNGERILCSHSFVEETNGGIICITFALNSEREWLQICIANQENLSSVHSIDVVYVEPKDAKETLSKTISMFYLLPDDRRSSAENGALADVTAQIELIIAWIEREVEEHAAHVLPDSESRIKAKVMVTDPAKAGLLALNLYENPIVCDFCFHIFEHYFYFVFGNDTVSVCRSEYPSLEVKEEFIAPIGNLPVRDNWRPNGDKRDIAPYVLKTSGVNTIAVATFICDTLNEIYDWYISRMHPIEHHSSIKSVPLHIPKEEKQEETERKENLEKLAVAESEAEKSIHDGDVDCPIAIETEEEMQPLTAVAGKGISAAPVEDGVESKNVNTRRLFRDNFIFSLSNREENYAFFRQLEDKCIAKMAVASGRKYDATYRSVNSMICPIALYESVPVRFEEKQRVFLSIYELTSLSYVEEHRFSYAYPAFPNTDEYKSSHYQPIYHGIRRVTSIDRLRDLRYIGPYYHHDDSPFIKEEINACMKWIWRWGCVMLQMLYPERKEAHNE